MRDSSEYINIMFSQTKERDSSSTIILCFHKLKDSSEFINIMFSQTNEGFNRAHYYYVFHKQIEGFVRVH